LDLVQRHVCGVNLAASSRVKTAEQSKRLASVRIAAALGLQQVLGLFLEETHAGREASFARLLSNRPTVLGQRQGGRAGAMSR
jgi:hypothetical protein